MCALTGVKFIMNPNTHFQYYDGSRNVNGWWPIITHQFALPNNSIIQFATLLDHFDGTVGIKLKTYLPLNV